MALFNIFVNYIFQLILRFLFDFFNLSLQLLIVLFYFGFYPLFELLNLRLLNRGSIKPFRNVLFGTCLKCSWSLFMNFHILKRGVNNIVLDLKFGGIFD